VELKAENTRDELRAITTMRQLDAVGSPTDLIKQAEKWGHEAVAITDHAVVQGFPEAHHASANANVKVIYGLEANLVDDGIPIAYNEKKLSYHLQHMSSLTLRQQDCLPFMIKL